VLHHPQHPDLVVKVYGPGRPGLEQEAEVYRQIGFHPAFSQCFSVGDGYLVLRRLHGTTLYDCLKQGILIPGLPESQFRFCFQQAEPRLAPAFL
jgi:hypothetical protein